MFPQSEAHLDTTQRLNRRTFLAAIGGAGAALLIAGCGSDEGADASETVPTTEPTAGTETESGTGSTRVVQDGRGEVQVPASPKRVITTEQTLDLAVLGLAPVGARNLESDTRLYPEFAELLKDTVDLGGQDLDLEQVLALEPDLIITTMGRVDVADQFEQMAPTVFMDIDTPDKKHRWDDTLLFLGEVLGRDQEAADLLAAYHARCEDFRTQMGDRLADTLVSVIRVGDDNMKVYTLGSFSGGVLRDAGMLRPAGQDLDAFETEALTNGSETEGFDLSPERLREADGDVIFVCVSLPSTLEEYDDGDRAVRANADALKENPLWTQLAAVQSGQTFEVGRHWNGESVVDANRMLDDLFRLLLGSE